MHEHAAVAATCTEAGSELYYSCDRCGKYFSDVEGQHEIQEDSWVIAALGHSLTRHAAVAATCTTAGNEEYYECTVCDKYFSDAAGTQEIAANSWLIPALGHSLHKHEATEPDCEHAGNTEYYECERCGKFFEDAASTREIARGSWIISATGHNLVKTNAVEPDCEHAGNSEYYTCSACGKFFSDAEGQHEIEENSWVVAALGHDLVKHEATAAACTTAGNSEYYECSRCGKFFSDAAGQNEIEENSWIIPAPGHNFGEDPNCLGKWICLDCGEYICSVVPTIDFQTNGVYGMYDWYKSFTAPDASWVTTPSAGSIQFLTYNPGYVSEVRLPNIFFAGFDLVSIDLSITYQNEKYSFNENQSDAYTIPSDSYSTKLVFSSITETSMTVTLRDAANVVLLSKTVTDADVLNGADGFKFYAEGVYTGVGYEVLSNFTFIENHVHNYVADPNCIGKESCADCLDTRATSTISFDFTQSKYGAYDTWDGNGTDPNWVVASGADKIQFVNAANDGSIFNYHLPRIYFASLTKVTIDLVVNYEGETFALDHDYSSSWAAPFSVYDHAQLVFEDITSSSMTVKFNDAFGNTQMQVTCTNVDVLNGLEGFVMFAKGSGNIAYDTFQNFTFVA